MVALGPIIGPRKPDCACSCSWDPTESLCVLLGSSPFHKRAPVTLCSKHNNKKGVDETEPRGINSCSVFFSRMCGRFLFHGNKDEFVSVTIIHLTFSIPHSKSSWNTHWMNEWKTVKHWRNIKCHYFLLIIDITILVLSKTNSSCTSLSSYRKGPSARKPKICIIVTKLSGSDCFYLKD